MTLALKVTLEKPFLSYPLVIAAGLVNFKHPNSISVFFVTSEENTINKSIALTTEDNKSFYDQLSAVEFLAKRFPNVLLKVYQSSKWADFSLHRLANDNPAEIMRCLEELNSHLDLRSYLVDYECSIADIFVYGVLKSNARLKPVIQSNIWINVSRWFDHMEAKEQIKKAVSTASSAISKHQRTKKDKKGTSQGKLRDKLAKRKKG